MTTNTDARADTIELNASVNGYEMYAYYVAGCCGARSLYGFDGKVKYVGRGTTKVVTAPTPEEVIEGIVISGVSGCLMLLTDVYNNGAQLAKFKEFVEANELGNVTICTPVRNAYTSAMVHPGVFTYDPNVLANWLSERKKALGQPMWSREGWYDKLDALYMDGVFYQGGGRPKPKKYVYRHETLPAVAAASAHLPAKYEALDKDE